MPMVVFTGSPLHPALASRRRGTGSPGRAPIPGAFLGITAVAALLGVAGCGASQGSAALPGKSAPPAVPAATASQASTTQDQVTAAYTGYWQALGQALDARNAAQAQAILAPYAAPAMISSLVSGFETDWAHGEIQYGSPVLHIQSVQVSGSHASVHDCADFSQTGVQEASTGQLVGNLGNPRVNMISVLVLTGSKWLLTEQVPVVAACTP
jgi:hypothetical protein